MGRHDLPNKNPFQEGDAGYQNLLKLRQRHARTHDVPIPENDGQTTTPNQNKELESLREIAQAHQFDRDQQGSVPNGTGKQLQNVRERLQPAGNGAHDHIGSFDPTSNEALFGKWLAEHGSLLNEEHGTTNDAVS